MNLKVLTSFSFEPVILTVASFIPKVSEDETLPEASRWLYLFPSVLPVCSVESALGDIPDGRPDISIFFIFPELSHTFNSGLNVAPLKIVKSGSWALVPNEIPFKVACGFSLSATLNVIVFLIDSGA